MKQVKWIFTIVFLLTSQVYSQSLQWRDLPGVPYTGRYDDIYFINATTGWAITYDKIYKTTNSGESWTLYQQPGSNRSIGFFDSQTGIVGTLDSARPMSRTTNGGQNWIPVTNFSSIGPRGICGISIIDENTAVASGTYYSTARAYKSTDKGNSWTLIFNDTSLARSLVDCYFWSPDSGLIVGGYNVSNPFQGNSVVLITTNGGVNWQRVFKSTRTKEWCWKISFKSKSFGVVSIERAYSDGLSYFLKTTNGGFNWTETPFLAYDQEGIGFINESYGWIGGYGTITSDSTYETTDGGLSWHVVGWGIRLNRIRFINDTLAFASGALISKYSRTSVGIEPVNTEIPERFNLHQNYPNPFNPITLIKFDISHAGNNYPVKVKLIVYDQLGKKVRILVNENLSPGSYQASFDAGYFPSGIYFYRLEAGSLPVSSGGAGNYSSVRKMMLLK